MKTMPTRQMMSTSAMILTMLESMGQSSPTVEDFRATGRSRLGASPSDPVARARRSPVRRDRGGRLTLMPGVSTYRVYPYRWVVLAVFTLVNVTIQTLWIGYAPITGQAAAYYGVSDTAIGAFAMVFMLAFIPLSLPAAWLIDTRGFRFATGLGAVVMGACGILRGLAGANYAMAMAATLGIAAAQPLLLNAWTKMPARWFAPGQRATAVGVVTVGNLVGTAAGMVLGPVLIESMPIGQIQLAYGVIAAFSAVLFLVLAREHPPTPACPPGQEERALVLDGLSHALRVKAFWYVLAIAFIGLGVFNGLTTWVEAMLRPRGFSPADAGTLGAVLLLGGLIGAVVLPALSDRQAAPPALPRPRLRRGHPRVGRRHVGRLATGAARSRDSCSGSSWSRRCRSGSSTPPR